MKHFFLDLISDNDSKSSTRFASLVALAVSSWVIIYATLNFEEQTTSDLFLYYISVFALQYGVGKGLSVLKGKGIESKGD